jgi:hypothetical protein
VSTLRFGLFSTAILVLIGCDAPKKAGKVPVTTRVTMANGQPVRDVLCCFVPHTALQTPGEFPLDANGNVTKTANGAEPLLQPGKYSVYFQPLNARSARDQARFAAAFKLIPTKYVQLSAPALEVDVDSSGGALAVQLTP